MDIGLGGARTMEETFNDPVFSDCEIHCGDKIFKVSKYLLCLHSDVFLAYFRNDSEESKTGVIKIEDLDSFLVEHMLKFMYGIEVENLREISYDLFKVADRYNVKGLMETCLDTIKEHITIFNLQKSLDLSFQFNFLDLEEKCVEFILDEMKEEQNVEGMKLILSQNPEISFKVLKKSIEEAKEANQIAQENQRSNSMGHPPHVSGNRFYMENAALLGNFMGPYPHRGNPENQVPQDPLRERREFVERLQRQQQQAQENLFLRQNLGQ